MCKYSDTTTMEGITKKKCSVCVCYKAKLIQVYRVGDSVLSRIAIGEEIFWNSKQFFEHSEPNKVKLSRDLFWCFVLFLM